MSWDDPGCMPLFYSLATVHPLTRLDQMREPRQIRAVMILQGEGWMYPRLVFLDCFAKTAQRFFFNLDAAKIVNSEGVGDLTQAPTQMALVMYHVIRLHEANVT